MKLAIALLIIALGLTACEGSRDAWTTEYWRQQSQKGD